MAETADWTTHLVRAAGAQRLLQTDALAGSHPWNPNSAIETVPLSRAVNMKRCGVTLARVLPGKESFVYHLHHREEEWIYVLSGRGIAEIGNDEFEVGPGDFMGFPTPSVGHHMRNPFDTDLIYLMGGESVELDVSEFPRLGKRMIRWGTGFDSATHAEIYDLAAAKPMGPLEG